MEATPPIDSLIGTAMAVVAACGKIEAMIAGCIWMSLPTTITLNKEPIEPIVKAKTISNQYFFKTSRFLYKGIAKATVAGSRKKLMYFPPSLYCS